MTGSEQLTDAEIAALARNLAGHLEDPHEGLASWQLARALMAEQLHRALATAMGKECA